MNFIKMKRVGVIGLGNIANRHRENLKKIFPEADIFAMSSRGRNTKDVIPSCDYFVNKTEDLINANVELVIVASPASYHAKHALPLISASIPVLIEKPVTTNLEDINKLLNASKKHKTPTSVAYCLRYLPSAKKIRDLLAKETIGKIHNSFVEVGQYLPNWRQNKNYRKTVSANPILGGGALFELSHELDYIQWILGNLTINSAILRSSDTLKLEVEDIVDVVSTVKKQTVVSIHLDFLQQFPFRQCKFIGSKGCINWNLLKDKIILYNINGQKTLFENKEINNNDIYVNMVLDFLSLIKGKNNQCVSLQEAKKTIILINQIRNVAKKQRNIL